MAIYTFDNITPAQALSFAGATDLLLFGAPNEVARNIIVSYGATTITLQSVLTGRSVVFGTGIGGYGGSAFPDGSRLLVGSAAGDFFAVGEQFAEGNTADAMFGADGADSLGGGNGADVIQGNQGTDTINAGTGDNFVNGNLGDDSIVASTGTNNLLIGEAGNDSVAGGTGSDVIDGGEGADILTGAAGNDTVIGGAGADSIASGAGADVLFGGEGVDRFSFSDPSGLGAQIDEIRDWETTDQLRFNSTALNASGNNIVATSLGRADATNYVEATAGSFAEAQAAAASQFSNPAITYVAVAVGADVVVFTDVVSFIVGGLPTDDQTIVKLVGRSLTDIAFQNIV